MSLTKSLLLFSGLTIFSAYSSSCEQLMSLSWLLGNWQSSTDNSVITESWQQVSATTFEGIGITLQADKQSQETMRLLDMNGELFYLAKVQHNALPAAFALSSCEPNQVTFVNPQHDFPKQLTYRKTQSGLQVEVTDGQDSGFTLQFTRAQ